MLKNRDRTRKAKGISSQRRAPSRTAQKSEFKGFYDSVDCIYTIIRSLVLDGFNRHNFLHRSADFLRKDLSTIDRRQTSEGIGFVAKVLPSLFQYLLNYLETGISHYPGFRKASGREYPAFMQQYFAEIYDEKVCEADKAKYVESLYQICVAFKKLKGPYRNCVLRKQLADFVETDIELRYLKFKSDSAVAGISRYARNFITNVIKDLNVDEQTRSFVPRPGPGATNIPVEKHLRFRPHVLYTQANDEFPYEDWFYSHPWDIVDDPHKHPFKLKKQDAPTSRFKFVPKTYGKPRGICIENLEIQYLQQALKKGLCDRLESYPLTKGKVNFKSQKVNGDLALSSSKTLEHASIDMSEASDRVSRDLVHYLFGGNDDFRNKLMSLSTRIIELPDEINFIREFPTAKFAPMGSALCFPIMSLVHFALIRGIISEHCTPDKLDSVYVYGDDIILPSEYVQAVYTYLPCFGMKLNENKSYYKSYFRESCGVHAYYGKCITPTYFKYVPTINMCDEDFMSLLVTEGQLYEKGWFHTASLLRDLILQRNKYGFKTMPYVSETSSIPGFIRSNCLPLGINTKNFKVLARRWNQDYLSYEFKTWVIRPHQDKLPPIKQDEGYLRWMLMGMTTEVGRPEFRFIQSTTSSQYVAAMLPLKQMHVKGSLAGFTCRPTWILESALNNYAA